MLHIELADERMKDFRVHPPGTKKIFTKILHPKMFQ